MVLIEAVVAYGELTWFWMCLSRVQLSLITYFSSKNPNWKWLKCCLKSFSYASKQIDAQLWPALVLRSRDNSCFLFVLHLVLIFIELFLRELNQNCAFKKTIKNPFTWQVSVTSRYHCEPFKKSKYLKYLKLKGICFTINITILLLKTLVLCMFKWALKQGEQ